MPGVGDPGFFGILGGILGKAAGAAKFIPGPIGAAASLVQKAVAPRQATLPQQFQPLARFQPTAQQLPPIPQVPTPGLIGKVQRFLPAGETGYEDAPPIGAPSGYHVNKSDYFLKDGTFIPAGSRWVRNRHRNPLNPRAASKAIGRIESLKRATKRFSRITIRSKCKS